jgi:hypothetical protein
MEQRATVKFFVKLKQTATETFEMLKSAYGEECLSRTRVFEWHKSSSESANEKSWVTKVLTGFVDAKSIIHHKFVTKTQIVNGKFYKEVIRDRSLEFIALGLSFRKVGPGIFCTTMHRRILRAFSPNFWRNGGFPCYPILLLP